MPEPEGKAVSGHQPLSEVILKVLAENGRHFTALADGERISVAVTFHGAANCTIAIKARRGKIYPPITTPISPRKDCRGNDAGPRLFSVADDAVRR